MVIMIFGWVCICVGCACIMCGYICGVLWAYYARGWIVRGAMISVACVLWACAFWLIHNGLNVVDSVSAPAHSDRRLTSGGAA